MRKDTYNQLMSEVGVAKAKLYEAQEDVRRAEEMLIQAICANGDMYMLKPDFSKVREYLKR